MGASTARARCTPDARAPVTAQAFKDRLALHPDVEAVRWANSSDMDFTFAKKVQGMSTGVAMAS